MHQVLAYHRVEKWNFSTIVFTRYVPGCPSLMRARCLLPLSRTTRGHVTRVARLSSTSKGANAEGPSQDLKNDHDEAHSSQSSQPSPSTTVPTELPPVLDFPGAIFPSHSLPPRSVHPNTHSQALQLGTVRWSTESRPHHLVTSASSFNDTVVRMRNLGVDVQPKKLMTGMLVALEEPEALRLYLRMWFERRSQLHNGLTEYDPLHESRRPTNRWSTHHAQEDMFGEFVSGLLRRLHKVEKGWSPTQDKRIGETKEHYHAKKKLQYLEVLTGLTAQEKKSSPYPRERRPSFYHLLAHTKVPKLYEVWYSYISLVYKFGGKCAVELEWNDWQSLARQNVAIANHNDQTSLQGLQKGGTRKPLVMQRRWGSLPHNTACGHTFWNCVIRKLVKEGHWQEAWAIAYERGEDMLQYIKYATWTHLLAYPQGCRKWEPWMEKHAMFMLERKCKELEEQLGVEWIGTKTVEGLPVQDGDGYHVRVEGKAFWEREDEEEVQRVLGEGEHGVGRGDVEERNEMEEEEWQEK